MNYKEAYELLYWLEDHTEIGKQYQKLYLKIKEVLDDDHLDCIEAAEIKFFLEKALRELNELKRQNKSLPLEWCDGAHKIIKFLTTGSYTDQYKHCSA